MPQEALLKFVPLTFDDHEGAPLPPLPAGADQPAPHLLDQDAQVLGVALHDLVKLGELAWPEEDLGQTELVVVLIQTQRMEQSLELKIELEMELELEIELEMELELEI